MIQHMAGGCDGAAVEIDAHIGINAGITGEAAGAGADFAAVYHQPAVGIDAVALTCFAGNGDIHMTCVDGGDGNAVLVGVDAVVAAADIDLAAVDGQMQFGVKPLVFRVNVQSAVA